MANTFKLEIVTPERILLSDDVVETNAPGSEGYVGILAGHMSLLTSLRPGEVRAKFPDGRPLGRYVVSGGFLEVSPVKTTILADSAEAVDEIDLAQAEADLAERRKRVTELEAGSAEHRSALHSVAIADARVQSVRG
ncbi:MAG: ATP synthase F1 subunit epsilon [Capsulimonadaceae bacterium]|nr:ATP synthase F1 subunit epsilon [Capsulimonadaceae bacterium]